MANRTSDLFVFVRRERYQWLFCSQIVSQPPDNDASLVPDMADSEGTYDEADREERPSRDAGRRPISTCKIFISAVLFTFLS